MHSDTMTHDDLLAHAVATGDKKALARFVRLGPKAYPAVRRGLVHPSWKIRRDSLRFLDHHMNREFARAAVERLRDEHPEVRKWAAHALGCDHCKQGVDLGLDPVPHLIDTARNDESLRVRRSAVVALAWTQPPDERILDLLRALRASTDDAKIGMHAEQGAARHSAGLA